MKFNVCHLQTLVIFTVWKQMSYRATLSNNNMHSDELTETRTAL